MNKLSWSKSDIETVLARLDANFKKAPHRFFTEHDIHSHLLWLVEAELGNRGKLFVRSCDGHITSLVHLEYPTPFRCDMSKRGFRIVSDEEKTSKGGLYRRGHYDLVILNPEFVRRYDLVIVSGKNYESFCSVRDEIDVTPLLWVCEIVFGAHVEDDLPRNWVKNVTQDALKVIDTLGYKVGKGAHFAKSGSVLVFLGVTSEKTKKLEEEIRQFSLLKGFKIRFFTPLP